MSEETKPTAPADEITKASLENTVELTERDLEEVAGGGSLDQKTYWKT